jgi:hypothetical protein
MIRIASVFAPHTQPPLRPAPPQLPQQAPLMPPVTPANAAAKLSADQTAAQSEAAFALVLSRAAGDTAKAPAPYQPQFADPLPDLPSVDAPEDSTPTTQTQTKAAR